MVKARERPPGIAFLKLRYRTVLVSTSLTVLTSVETRHLIVYPALVSDREGYVPGHLLRKGDPKLLFPGINEEGAFDKPAVDPDLAVPEG
jgi:hypothetical protein